MHACAVRLHLDAVLEADVGGAKHVLSLVDEVRHVMEAAGVPVASLVYVSYDFWFDASRPGLAAVVEHDLLGELQAEGLLEEDPGLGRIGRQQVDVVEMANAGAAARVPLRLVLQTRDASSAGAASQRSDS